MSEAFHDLSGHPAASERGREAYASLLWMHEHVAAHGMGLRARRIEHHGAFQQRPCRIEFRIR